MTAQFTPGPWRVVSMAYNVKNGPQTEFGVVNGDRMNEADAHLITAAPELYEALQWAFDGTPGWPALAEAALAKARGEPA